MAGQAQGWLLVQGCSHVAPGRSGGLFPALGWGWEFSLVSEDGGWRKATGRLFRAGWCPGAQVGSVLKESAGESKSDVQRNKNSFLLPPVQILGSAHKFSQT